MERSQKRTDPDPTGGSLPTHDLLLSLESSFMDLDTWTRHEHGAVPSPFSLSPSLSFMDTDTNTDLLATTILSTLFFIPVRNTQLQTSQFFHQVLFSSFSLCSSSYYFFSRFFTCTNKTFFIIHYCIGYFFVDAICSGLFIINRRVEQEVDDGSCIL